MLIVDNLKDKDRVQKKNYNDLDNILTDCYYVYIIYTFILYINVYIIYTFMVSPHLGVTCLFC